LCWSDAAWAIDYGTAMADPAIVSVEFVDASSGEIFARTRMPADQLPPSFGPDTPVDIAGNAWSVVRADPPTAAEFSAAGRLVLTLHRIERVSPHDMLYSLPTICDALPAAAPHAPRGDCLTLHEDDWRQVELVSAGLDGVVQAEFAAIRLIFMDQAVAGPDGRVVGFRRLHVRAEPAAPLACALPAAELPHRLPAVRRSYSCVAVGGAAAAGAFAFGLGPLCLYGVAAAEAVTVLGLHPDTRGTRAVVDNAAAGLASLMRTYDLTLVDWCRRASVGPESVADYLYETL
jgi:hypothetical protein